MTLSGTINKAAILLAILVAATGGIGILYMVEGGPWGIAFSLFVVGIAALNLVMDFDFIVKGVAQRNPKYMEWYSAFGLML